MCRIHFLFQEHQCILRLLALVCFVARMFVQHFRKLPAQAKLRYVPVVERQGYGTVIFGVNDKVRNDLLEVLADRFSQRTSRTRVQLGQFSRSCIVLFFGDTQFLDDFIFVFSGKLVAALANDIQFNLFQRRSPCAEFAAADIPAGCVLRFRQDQSPE